MLARAMALDGAIYRYIRCISLVYRQRSSDRRGAQEPHRGASSPLWNLGRGGPERRRLATGPTTLPGHPAASRRQSTPQLPRARRRARAAGRPTATPTSFDQEKDREAPAEAGQAIPRPLARPAVDDIGIDVHKRDSQNGILAISRSGMAEGIPTSRGIRAR